MIIGYNFFGYEFHGNVWDTGIAMDMIDELQLNEGVYDEVFVDLDTSLQNTVEKPIRWTMRTIMDAKFTGDLDAGSVNAEGFNITKLLLYRALDGINNWDIVGEFEYNKDYNLYDYVDRYVKNGASYRYSIVPVANEIQGDILTSDKIDVIYNGIFLTDKYENRKLEYDVNLGTITHNKQSSINQPIRGQYPIVVFGNSNYKTGNISFMPLSKETALMYGSGIDVVSEHINREEWIKFINNNKAKVLRMDNGVIMLIVTQNLTSTPKDGVMLRDLVDIGFDYIEIGELNYENLIAHDLLSNIYLSDFTFDDFGGIISD